MGILLFEDGQVGNLCPITLARPAFAISCGSFRLTDLVATLGQQVTALVRPHLKSAVAADHPNWQVYATDDQAVLASSEPWLLVNARLVPAAKRRQELADLIKQGVPSVIVEGQQVTAALVATTTWPEIRLADFATLLATLVQSFPASQQVQWPLMTFPHDVVQHHLATLDENLQARLTTDQYQEIADGVLAAGNVTLGEHTVTDSRHGPIVLEAGSSVGPLSYLEGPIYLGPHSRVSEQASIKHGVSIGHRAKIGGEVEASIIEPYTNKQHAGFLGHSYLGSWINLGAGTSNSDLKNTYGLINVEHRGKKVSTGMQFMGIVMGDYSKTAINTSIFTGKTIGLGSMLYGFVTTNVPSFVNYARQFGQLTAIPVKVLVATQARMFARRQTQPRPCDVQLLYDVYQLTHSERDTASVSQGPLSL